MLINNSLIIANSSPQFLNDPQFLFCYGQETCINHGVNDPDGDSLAYQLVPAPTGVGQNDVVQYLPGYSQLQPLNSLNPVMFNSQTGTMCFTPTNFDLSLWNVRAHEYRNGNYLGYAEREMMMLVEPCPNSLPQLSGYNGSNMYTIDIPAGINSCFTIYSSDGNSQDSTFISTSDSLPGMSIQITGAQNEYTEICWTPSVADIRINPYCFTLNVKDNACPYTGYNKFDYCLIVGLAVSTGELESSDFQVYPNPVIDQLNLSGMRPGEFQQIILSDLSGRILIQEDYNAGTFSMQLDQLSPGIYILSVKALYLTYKTKQIMKLE